MAVRRAKIKPVISLPPRRKNGDAGRKTSTQTFEEETIEKLIKSPQTPLDTITGTQDNVDKRSPKPDCPVKSSLPETNVILYQGETVPSSLAQTVVTKEVSVIPKSSKKVCVVSDKVIVSPRNVGIPVIRPLLNRPAVAKFTYGRKKNVPCTIVSSEIPNYDTVIDGIEPLQAASADPKALVMVQNSILSESGEVLFDPIVPLPSMSTVQPKLLPVPRLPSLGRNSLQGSASESEDERRSALLGCGCRPRTAAPCKRQRSQTSLGTMPALPNRKVSRVRNDSVNSSVSQAPKQSAVTLPPVKDKHGSKCMFRRLEAVRKAVAMRRRAEAGTRDTLTMYDLIYYNPTSNPMVPDKDEIKAKEANEEIARKAAKESEGKAQDTPKANRAPVPQIKLGPNGEIILDEKSLVISQSEKRTISSSTVHEVSGSSTSKVGGYRRKPRSKEWSDAETMRFYRAFASVGTDFMMMEGLFPSRTRTELKLKYKKEERANMALIEKAIRVPGEWDMTRLMDEFKAEREAEEKEAREAEEEAREMAAEQQARTRKRPRMCQSSKALGSSVLPPNKGGFTANDIIELHKNKAFKKKTPQKSSKRGRPKYNPSPLPATITQEPPNTQPTDDVATTRIIDSPKPQDKMPEVLSNMPEEPSNMPEEPSNMPEEPSNMPEEPSNMPEEPSNMPEEHACMFDDMPADANVEDGSIVVFKIDDPDSPSEKIFKIYQASDGGKLTPIVAPSWFIEKVDCLFISENNEGSSPHLTSPAIEASQDGHPSSTRPSITQL